MGLRDTKKWAAGGGSARGEAPWAAGEAAKQLEQCEAEQLEEGQPEQLTERQPEKLKQQLVEG